MNKEIIENALNNALYLISEEYQSLMDEDLKENYESVIDDINNALKELEEFSDGK